MKIIVLPDVHMTTEIPKEYELVKKFIAEQNPDEIILLGDFMDCSSLSHWNESKSRAMEGQRWNKEVKLANKELDFLQEHTNKITYLEGNHENWVEQYIDKHPEMEGLIEIPKKLKLKKRNITWYKYNTLYQVGNLYFTHGCYTGKYHAAKHLQSFGCNIVYGHAHNTQTAMMNMRMQEPHMAYGLGCLCDHSPEYMHGRPANWINQVCVVYVNDKGNFNVYPINIIDCTFIWEGKEYSLE